MRQTLSLGSVLQDDWYGRVCRVLCDIGWWADFSDDQV